MTKIEQLTARLQEPLAAKGYEILQMTHITTGRHKLEILLERLDEGGVTLDDCAAASRIISGIFDVEDPIPDAYTLEVSSPGMDRPLVRLRDYERFQGSCVKVTLHDPRNGQKNFKGRIHKVLGEKIFLQLDDENSEGNEPLCLEFGEICRCKILPVL
jgi:ribosome maturation factor RimP